MKKYCLLLLLLYNYQRKKILYEYNNCDTSSNHLLFSYIIDIIFYTSMKNRRIYRENSKESKNNGNMLYNKYY